MKLQRSIIIMVLILTVAGCTHTLWMSENYKLVKSNIDTISIIIPQIEYYEKDVKTNKPRAGYSMYISAYVAEAVKEIIDEGGSIAKSSIMVCDSEMIGRWLSNNFYNSIDKYKRIRDSLHTTQNGEKIFPTTPELQLLIDRVKTKHFIFIRGAAFRSSEKSIQYDALQLDSFKLFFDHPLSYDHQWYSTKLEIILVDTKSKEILWSNSNKYNDSNYDPFNKAEVKRLCQILLKSN